MSATSKVITLRDYPRARPRLRSQVANQSEQRPDEDAVAIGALYRKGREAVRESIKYYLQAGQKLIRRKDLMPHGAWLRWLRANADMLGFKHPTTASRLMKAAAANDALTHPLNEAEAIQIDRRLWGNLAAMTMAEAELGEIEFKKKASQANRSTTDTADECIEAVRAAIEFAVIRLKRANAPCTKFERLFGGLADILVDLQRQTLVADYEPRRRMRRLITLSSRS